MTIKVITVPEAIIRKVNVRASGVPERPTTFPTQIPRRAVNTSTITTDWVIYLGIEMKFWRLWLSNNPDPLFLFKNQDGGRLIYMSDIFFAIS